MTVLKFKMESAPTVEGVVSVDVRRHHRRGVIITFCQVYFVCITVELRSAHLQRMVIQQLCMAVAGVNV